jgi:hypothetical protein
MKIKILRPIPMREVPARFYDPERDGVTFSLLTSFKQCREKTRLILNGWTSTRNSLGTVFGTLAHAINQQMYNDVRSGRLTELPSEKYIKATCREIETLWKKENPRADGDSMQYLEFSMILLEALMPVYFKYWKKDFSFVWEKVEAEFRIPITIDHPNGKSMSTFIRGKIDGSFGKKKGARPWLFETKTKSRLGEEGEGNIAEILPHDLQVNIYLLYLWWVDKKLPDGVLYNIIRRPGLRQKKKESVVQFARRVAADVRLRPEWYFIRLQMFIEKKDLERQELELRDLVSDFLLWWHGEAGHYKNSDQCENKYGTCPFLPVCNRGDYSGFFKRKTVFRELSDQM